jgi:hypothetical protein
VQVKRVQETANSEDGEKEHQLTENGKDFLHTRAFCEAGERLLISS